jgi:hypothetical protein
MAIGNTADAASAETQYADSLSLAAELGMRPLAAHCRLGLGKLHQRMGSRGQAQEHLAAAAAMYRGMGMRWWLDLATAELERLE